MPETQVSEGNTPASIAPEQAVVQIEALLDAEEPQEQQQVSETPRPPLPETPEDRETPDQPPEEAEESQEEPEGEAKEPTEEEAEPMVAVQLDGSDVEMPLSEVVNGYMRTKDYTHKTQDLAEARKQLESAAVQLVQERQAYAQLIPRLEDLFQQQFPQEPDWQRLAQTVPPDQYWQAKTQWDAHSKRMEALAQEKSRVTQLQQLDMIEKLQNHLSTAQEILIQEIPRWKDERIATADKQALKSYAKKSGFSDYEIQHAYDHRVLVWGHKARLYDEMMGAKPRPVPQNGKPVLRPGSVNQSLSTRSQITRAKQRLAKTGRPADAVTAIELILARGG